MKRHRFEPTALVMGLVLIGLAVAFFLDVAGVGNLSDPNLSIPVAGTCLGLVVATGVVTQGVRTVRALRKRRSPRR
ncbi:hypothetical protein OG896_14695 [Streptomyces sp. NBC_00669]|uniref:hypothetical protein n=1 Tax=unclassified Streptomyces TaxID=2593676 RepID=UPI002E379A42|nr:hypothetical protein [Streptomyces sp. NBC_00669]